MSEPITDYARTVLGILQAEQDDLARDLSPEDIQVRLTRSRTGAQRVRLELEKLEWRGLTERDGVTRKLWRISEKGTEAL